MFKETDYNLIHLYITGELSEEEAAAIKARIKKDSLFAQKVHTLQSMDSFLEIKKDIDIVKQQIYDIGQTYFVTESIASIEPQTPIKVVPMWKKHWLKWSGGVAAVIIAFFFYPSSSLYDSYAQHQSLSIEKNIVSEQLNINQAYTYYNSKKYALALPIFKLFLEKQPSIYPNIMIAKGVCELELNNYDAAQNSFQEVIDQHQIARNAGYWYLALTALKQEQYAKCQSFLEKINSKSDYYPISVELSRKLPKQLYTNYLQLTLSPFK